VLNRVRVTDYLTGMHIVHTVRMCASSSTLQRAQAIRRNTNMRAEYDFSKGKRGALIPQTGKTRITIYIDNAVLDEFRARAERAGTGYQTMMNEALKASLGGSEPPVTEAVLRQVIREELPRVSRLITRSSGSNKKRRAG